MGCLLGRGRRKQANEESQSSEQQQRTVDKYTRITPSQEQNDDEYVFEKLVHITVGKVPGQINGEDFAIDDCKDANMFIFDHTSVVTVDDCHNCQIFIGPCKGSVFLRDCTDCVLMVACQQFRTRDCQRCTIYLHCTSQPVIEESVEMRFGCFQCSYPELRAQFKAAGLSVYNNNWNTIHDFTPELGNTWSVIHPHDDTAPRLSIPPSDPDTKLSQVNATFDPGTSIVPYTHGHKHVRSGAEECLVIFFSADDANERSIELVDHLRAIQELIIVTAKELKMKEDIMSALFDSHSSPPEYSLKSPPGNVIIIQFQGPSAISHCSQAVLMKTANTPFLVYCSPNLQQARRDIANLHQLLNRGLVM